MIRQVILRWGLTLALLVVWITAAVVLGVEQPWLSAIGGAVGLVAWWAFDPFFQRRSRL